MALIIQILANIKVYYDNGRNLEDKGYLYHERKSLYTGMNNAYR